MGSRIMARNARELPARQNEKGSPTPVGGTALRMVSGGKCRLRSL